MANSSASFVQSAEELQSAFKQVQNLFQPDFVNRWLKELEQYKEFASNPTFHVAVVGAIKAGKSTLLNAMLGDEITSTEVTPETAALTIFRYAPESYVKVKFHSRPDWDTLWESATEKPDSKFSQEFKDNNGEKFVAEWAGHKDIQEPVSSLEQLKTTVKRYSSSKSAEHYFVKELEIGLKDFPEFLPREIVLVDTPGLDDVVPYRSAITHQYINRANAVIVCINAKFLAGEQYRTVMQVFEQVSKPKKVVILGTQTDTFSNPKRDWEKQKLEWQTILGVFFKDAILMRQNLLGVSSRVFSLTKKLQAGGSLTDNEIGEVATFAKTNDIAIPAKVSNEDLQKALQTGGDVDMDKLVAKAQKRLIKEEKAPEVLESTGVLSFFDALKKGPLHDHDVAIQDDLAFKLQNLKDEVKNHALDVKKSVEEQVVVLSGTVEEKEAAIEKKKAEFEALADYNKTVEQDFAEMRSKVNAAIADVKSKLDAEMKTAIGGK